MQQFFILFIFKLLKGRQSVITIEIRVADLVDDVFTDDIHRGGQLIFDKVEKAVDGFLQETALGLDTTIHSVFLDQADDLLFR